MKRNLLLLSMLAMSTFTYAQLTEDFEGDFPPTGWSIETTNEDYTWEVYTDGPINGDQSANVQYDPALVDQDESLVSPEFTVPSGDDATLVFTTSLSYYWSVDPNNNYDFIVSISTDGGTTWTSIWNEDDADEFETYVPFDVSVNLSEYAGDTAQLKFQYAGSDGAQLVIDDISVQSTASRNEALASQFSVSPNPATNVINVSNSGNTVLNNVSVADINGRIVKSVKFDGVANAQLNISDLTSGVYMMTISSDKGTTTKKIIKN
ncbi:T9SS type A sorting domain-containing protein [Flavobacterium subsaxonicum]|uniref:Secretion system C-terminal sorting domain-containing protein n=1 Tax=Flavobacterium subsaxonicum WB 4.1-42 = DSM 21790 TaxID=1121898 RepID=A0A0A2MQ99_9FLAO|nr:T9SS type A sorting domain-containing protein [Flavobacterium subsaxonicum]KGO94857.1 hypothetical protein Q766_01700 [Flavobacterium subsaxonicum WB 4.1-42 = DSM 21790]